MRYKKPSVSASLQISMVLILAGCGGPNPDLQNRRADPWSVATVSIVGHNASLAIDVVNDRVSLNAVAVSLDRVLDALAGEALIKIEYASSLQLQNTLVEAQYDDMQLIQVIERLLGDRNLALEFDQDKLIAVAVLSRVDFSDDYDILFAELQDGDLTRRLNAISNLQGLPFDERIELYRYALGDGNPSLRLEAIDTLTAADREAAVEILAAGMFDVDPAVREAVVEALVDLGSETALPLLSLALDDADPDIREEAVEILGVVDHPFAAELLQRALLDNDAGVREIAAQLLHQ